jgi:hypothetical protein
LSCVPARLLVHPLVPSHWRKTVGLPGNASKSAVKAFIPTRSWNVDWPQDACDAYCIALATRTLLERVPA